MIRVYGGSKDGLCFERAVNAGLALACSVGDYENGTDFIYSWSAVSAVMAEQSWGYVELGMPEKTLAMREDITEVLRLGQDTRVLVWIPLDWAKAYKMMGEVEQCVIELRELYRRCLVMGSLHALSQVTTMLALLDREGYGDVPVVRAFREEIASAR